MLLQWQADVKREIPVMLKVSRVCTRRTVTPREARSGVREAHVGMSRVRRRSVKGRKRHFRLATKKTCRFAKKSLNLHQFDVFYITLSNIFCSHSF